jgi:hypothetical protein
LFFGIGIALILFSLEKLSKTLGLECPIFDSYGAVEEPSKYFGNKWMKLLLNKDEEISTLRTHVTFLKNQVSFSKNHRKSIECSEITKS